ncbi:MAG: AsmA family protein, partial [Bacteroidota bacterium]
MKFNWRPFKKILKYTGIATGSIIIILFLLPLLFPGTIKEKIKEWANSSIKGELNFSNVRLSFFNHFPSLTLTLYNFSLKGSAPFQKDTLVAGKELALGVNLSSLFGKAITIDEIYLTNGKLNVLTDATGHPNYNVYVSDTTVKQTTDTSSSASLKLARIQIDNCSLNYDDRSIPFVLKAGRVDYLGKGDLSESVFDLGSNIKMEKAWLNFNNQQYLENKRLAADLVTKINTSSLSLVFERNKLKINRLPLE